MTAKRSSPSKKPRPAKRNRPQTRDAEHRPGENEWSPFDDGPDDALTEVPTEPKPQPKKPKVANAQPEKPGDKGDRIAKLLARAGVASRREIERMIADNRVALHGQTVTTPATLLTSLHGITVDGKPVKQPEPTKLWCFHKPVGTLTAERDFSGRKTIYDTLKERAPDLPRVMPIGRLDLNTEGLLLLTNDGGFKREMELPATGVKRTYRARTFGDVSQDQLEELIDGVVVDGMRYGRIDANLERRTGRNQWIEITLREGKNREVRNVLKHLGLEVSRLIRTSYGPFTIGDLQPGDVSAVRKVDLIKFRKTLEKLNI
ncbi:MAG: pseudouridine synthase [Pseudomonadota bacterium]